GLRRPGSRLGVDEHHGRPVLAVEDRAPGLVADLLARGAGAREVVDLALRRAELHVRRRLRALDRNKAREGLRDDERLRAGRALVDGGGRSDGLVAGDVAPREDVEVGEELAEEQRRPAVLEV